jgi:hypothetical protein
MFLLLFVDVFAEVDDVNLLAATLPGCCFGGSLALMFLLLMEILGRQVEGADHFLCLPALLSFCKVFYC